MGMIGAIIGLKVGMDNIKELMMGHTASKVEVNSLRTANAMLLEDNQVMRHTCVALSKVHSYLNLFLENANSSKPKISASAKLHSRPSLRDSGMEDAR